MKKLLSVLTIQPLTAAAAHTSEHAGREAAGWLCILALSASMTFATTHAPLQTTIAASNIAGPYVPDGIPDGADAWSAGKIQLNPMATTDSH